MNHDATQAFVPTRLAGLVHQGVTEPGRPVCVSTSGATLFLDITGFSTLARQWAIDDGAGGADRLQRLLNTFFGPLVTQVEEHGGEVVRFAGDALLAVWTGFDDVRDAVSAATRCAQRMLADSNELGSIEGTRIQARVAVGEGLLHVARVGGPVGGWDLLLFGPGIRDLDEPLDSVPPQELRLSARAAMHLDGHTFPAEGATWGLLTTPAARSFGRTAPLDAPHDAYLADWLRQWLASEDRTWTAQMRTVTAAFVHFGTVLNDEAWAHIAHDVVGCLRRTITTWGGVQTQVVVDDKGAVWLGAFGLAMGQREYRPSDAISWAREAHAALEALGIAPHIGITTDRLFCGTLGNSTRHEVALVGSRINLAARLATQLKPGVYIDERTALAARSTGLRALPARTFKGFSQPVAIWTLDERSSVQSIEPAARRTRLVGRRAQAAKLMAGVQSGRYEVAAAAGMGKTRLGEEIAAHAESQGCLVVRLRGDVIRKKRPFHAWSHSLDSLLGLSDAPAIHADQLAERVRALGLPDAAVDLLMPLVGEASLGAETGGAGSLDALGEVMAELLGKQQTVLIVDDVQWLDSASAVLVTQVLHKTQAAAYLLRRLDAGEVDVGLSALVHDDDRLELPPLSRAEVNDLVGSWMGAAVVPDRLLNWVQSRCAGNPFYISEELAALRGAGLARVSGGVIHLADDAMLRTQAHPPTVVGSVTWRLDNLAPDARALVTAATVLGMDFELAALGFMLPHVPPHKLEALALGLVNDGVWGAAQAEGHYHFVHRTLRDVAYDSLVQASSAQLHEAAAAVLQTGDAPPAFIAHHLANTLDPARALPWYDAAAAIAIQLGASREAFELLGDALALDAKQPTFTPLERAQRLQRRAAMASRLGLTAACLDAADEALVTLGRPVPTSPLGWRWRLLTALLDQLAHRFLPRRPLRKAPEELVQAGLAWNYYTEGSYFQSGGPVTFLAGLLTTANIAERLGRGDIGIGAWGELAHIATLLGRDGLAESFIALARRAGESATDPMVTLRLVHAIHGHHVARCQWQPADEQLERLHGLAGQPSTAAFAPFALYRNVGYEVLRGRADSLFKTADVLHLVGQRTGSERCQAWSRHTRASGHLLRGEHQLCLEHTNAVIADPGGVDPITPLIARATHAHALALYNRLDEALEHSVVLAVAGPTTPMASITRLGIYIVPALVAIIRAEHHLDSPGLNVHDQLALCRTYQRRFSAAVPLTDWLHARQLRLDGHIDKAHAMLERARLGADERGLSAVVTQIELTQTTFGEA